MNCKCCGRKLVSPNGYGDYLCEACAWEEGKYPGQEAYPDPDVIPNYVFAWYGEEPMEYRANDTLIRAVVGKGVGEFVSWHNVTIYDQESQKIRSSYASSRRLAMELAQECVRVLVEKLKMDCTKMFKVTHFISDPPVTVTPDTLVQWECGSEIILLRKGNFTSSIPLKQIKHMEIVEEHEYL